jgi:hypothetical protein
MLMMMNAPQHSSLHLDLLLQALQPVATLANRTATICCLL